MDYITQRANELRDHVATMQRAALNAMNALQKELPDTTRGNAEIAGYLIMSLGRIEDHLVEIMVLLKRDRQDSLLADEGHGLPPTSTN